MKDKPKCCMPGCNNDALVFMYQRFFCGDCVSEMDRKMKDKMFEGMKEIMKDGN